MLTLHGLCKISIDRLVKMDKKEAKVFRETKLRNLKRRYSKMIQHPEFSKECIKLKSEIDSLESILN